MAVGSLDRWVVGSLDCVENVQRMRSECHGFAHRPTERSVPNALNVMCAERDE